MSDESVKAESPTLSVVLSFRNEAQNIPELVSRLRAVFDIERKESRIKSWELIFVNDASTDGSVELLKNLDQGHGDIRILNMSRNFGVAPCVLAGMSVASGDAVVYMDTDLQDPPEVIPQLLAAWISQKADVVHTVRLSRAGEPWLRRMSTRVGYIIIRYFAGINLQVEAGDFKLLSRRAVTHLLGLKEKNPYLRGLVVWVGFKQVNIQYHRHARYKGVTHFGTFSPRVLQYFLQIAFISFSEVPLQLTVLMGFFVAFCTFIYSVYIIIEFARGHNIPGWSAIMVTVLMLGATQQISIGLIGLYLNSIYLESKQRPNYIVESDYGFKSQSKQ